MDTPVLVEKLELAETSPPGPQMFDEGVLEPPPGPQRLELAPVLGVAPGPQRLDVVDVLLPQIGRAHV